LAPAGGGGPQDLALNQEPAHGVGFLEFSDNEFVRCVAAGLQDVPHALVRTAEVRHPAPPPFRLIVDRVSFCDPFLRRLMRYWSMAGAYVLNDPFFTLVHDKFSESLLYDALGIAHPRTILLPGRNGTEDVSEMVAPPDWDAIESAPGFPCILKPVDGYAWQDVFRVTDRATLQALHESLGQRRTMIVQELISWTSYYRAFCVNARDVLIVRWLPRPFDLGEYSMPAPGELGAAEAVIRQKTIELNSAFRLDFNAVEWCITADGAPVVIDALNDVPDVRRERLPGPAWDWAVDRLVSCIRQRLAEGARNTILSDPGAPAR
jgi:hypothetical protein